MTARTTHPRTAAAIAASVLVAGFAIATHVARAQAGMPHAPFARADAPMERLQPAVSAEDHKSLVMVARAHVKGDPHWFVVDTFAHG